MVILSIFAILISFLALWGCIEKTMSLQKQIDDIRLDMEIEPILSRRKPDLISKADIDSATLVGSKEESTVGFRHKTKADYRIMLKEMRKGDLQPGSLENEVEIMAAVNTELGKRMDKMVEDEIRRSSKKQAPPPPPKLAPKKPIKEGF